jgi:hypothetical protein
MGFMASDNLEYLQAEADSLPRWSLVTGVSTGQLGRRIATIGDTVTGRPVSPEAGPEWRERIQTMAHFFTPNLWGPALSKKTGHRAYLLAWLAMFAAALLLLVKPPGNPRAHLRAAVEDA